MVLDLTAAIDNYAIYIPALNTTFAPYVVSDDEGRAGIRPLDLNFLNRGSKLWTYRWALASAGQFASERRPNAITRRHGWSCIVGDSGGFQIGTGALRDLK